VQSLQRVAVAQYGQRQQLDIQSLPDAHVDFHRRAWKCFLGQGIRNETLHQTTGVSVKRLLYYNDVKGDKKPGKGELWYLKPKRGRANESYHIVDTGEDLWTVSQKYGIKLSKLQKKNRIKKNQTAVKPGRVLWLKKVRPADVPVAYISGVPADPQKPSPTTRNHAAPPVEKQETSELTPVDNPKYSTNSAQTLHGVKSGETLYSLSKEYGVTVAELRNWNGLAEDAVLSVGQQLRVHSNDNVLDGQTSVSGTTAPRFETYRVKAGDTLYQIARDHQTTIKELLEWNGKSDFNLSIGEELKVRKQP
jgi:membrane-bound lytic murein transglycosylase D